jgi:hypothetical protein
LKPQNCLRVVVALGCALSAGSASAGTNGWTLVAWNDLGMHCMDGSDYSVFSVFPPFNTVQAQLIFNGKLITNSAGLVVTYEAIADSSGSINRTSKDKINFWQYAGVLYGASPAPDVGLAGFAMPGPANTAQEMHFTNVYFVAEGVPITPFDDATNRNFYPLMRFTAKSNGVVLATTDVVLPVSDEMDCRACHRSGSGLPAEPAAGWTWDCQPERDVKLNILRLHDEDKAGNGLYSNALIAAGYNPSGLFATVVGDGKPILCAKCHKSNALPGTGLPGMPDLTHAVHALHASVIDPATGLAMDSAANRSACYRCHPGTATRCLRGVMGYSIGRDGAMAIQCQDCHGPMSLVGSTNRLGWLQEPLCQSCHAGTATNGHQQIRFLSVFQTGTTVRTVTDGTFAYTGALYRLAQGHGKLRCEACHGPTHAEYPTFQPNDNIQSTQIQQHVGTLGECAACHGSQPGTVSGGPHGMHPISDYWVQQSHKSAGEQPGNCRPCHGLDDRGTVLSRVFGDRAINTANFGTKRWWRGYRIGCYQCHRGPGSSSPTTNRWPTVGNVTASTTAGNPVSVTVPTNDVDRNALELRIVSQPAHGAAAVATNVVTYFPDPQFVGEDTFTFAAWDGYADSELGTGKVTVAQGPCSLTFAVAVPASVAVGAPAPFWGIATVSGCSNAATYTWSFGDGTNSAHQNACHACSATGTFNWVVVAGAGGTSVTHSGAIVIHGSAGDTDGDGILDAWETDQFGDLDTADATSDFDLDGFRDYFEFLAGTNPKNSQSYLKVYPPEGGEDGSIAIRWPSESNRVYVLSRSTDLLSIPFVGIATGGATVPTNLFVDPLAGSLTGAYYRIELAP